MSKNSHTWDEALQTRLQQAFSATRQTPSRREARAPLVNVYETPEGFWVTAELPGVAAEDIQLEVSEQSLTLSGTRALPDGVTDENFRRQERWTGNWRREFSFAIPVDPSLVTAEMHHGVVLIRLSKAERAKPRRVSVQPMRTQPEGS